MTNPPPSLTDEQVAAIRARLDARTPGQWLHRTVAPYGYVAKCGDSADASEYVTPRDLDWPANGAHHDAEFIAHAPEDIAALLTDRDRLARRVEELEAQLGYVTTQRDAEWERAKVARDGIGITVDATIPPDEVHFRQDGRTVGKIVNLAPRPTTEETPSPSPAQETP